MEVNEWRRLPKKHADHTYGLKPQVLNDSDRLRLEFLKEILTLWSVFHGSPHKYNHIRNMPDVAAAVLDQDHLQPNSNLLVSAAHVYERDICSFRAEALCIFVYPHVWTANNLGIQRPLWTLSKVIYTSWP